MVFVTPIAWLVRIPQNTARWFRADRVAGGPSGSIPEGDPCVEELSDEESDQENTSAEDDAS